MYALLQVSKDGFTLWSLLDLQTYAFDFWFAEKYFKLPWKSAPAKTGPARPVLLPLPFTV